MFAVGQVCVKVDWAGRAPMFFHGVFGKVDVEERKEGMDGWRETWKEEDGKDMQMV